MGNYCTASSIFDINPLLPRTGGAAFTSTLVTAIQAHERRAAGVIDAYCGKRYDMPFDSSHVPPVIRAIAEDLTSYYTYRSYFTQDNVNRSQYFDDLVAQARMDLEKIRAGEMDIFYTDGSEVTVSTEDAQSLLDSTTKDYSSYFDIDDETDWAFDSDLEDTVADGR